MYSSEIENLLLLLCTVSYWLLINCNALSVFVPPSFPLSVQV